MPKYIRYLENNEWKYASIKDVGNLSLLKSSKKGDIVEAINSLIDDGILDGGGGGGGGMTESERQQLLANTEAIEGLGEDLLRQIETINSHQQLMELLEEEKQALEARQGEIISDLESAKVDIINKADIDYVDGELVKKIDTEKYQREYDEVKDNLLDKVDMSKYEEEYVEITEKLSKKVEELDFNNLKGKVEEVETTVTDMDGVLSTKISSKEFDDAVGVNQWIASKYNIHGTNLSETAPSFALIKGEVASEVIDLSDSYELVAFNENNIITHFFTNVRLEQSKSIALNITYDDSLAIYMNGAMIYQNSNNSLTPITVTLSLRAGWNTIEILHGQETSEPKLTLDTMISSQVAKMTTVIGVGDKNETRFAQAETEIKQTKESIELKADSTVVTEMGNQIESNTSAITLMDKEIKSKVSEETLNLYNERLETAESTITQHADKIEAKVEKTDYDLLNGRVEDAETTIEQHSEAIELRVTKDTYNGLEERVSSAETGIKANSDAIELKASKTDLDTVTDRLETAESIVEQTAEAIKSTVTKTEFDNVKNAIDEDIVSLSDRVETAETTVTQTAEAIESKAEKSTVYTKEEMNTKISNLNTSITQTSEDIKLKANATDVYTKSQVNTELGKKANQSDLVLLVDRVSDAETEIGLTKEAITLKANATDVYTKSQVNTELGKKANQSGLNDLSTRVTNAEGLIEVQSEQIESRVTKSEIDSYVNGVKKIRYVRDWIQGSSSNTNNHWVEIKVISGNINRAKGKIPTSNGSLNNPAVITDEVTLSSQYTSGVSGLNQYVQIDLEEVYEDIDYIHVWHYYSDGRTYRKSKTEISDDGKNWVTVFDSAITGEYKETSHGRIVPINTGGITGLESRLSTAESKITQTEKDITLKVSQTDFNGETFISMINQTPETIKIRAGNIELSGAVSFSNFDSDLKSKASTWDSKADPSYVNNKIDSLGDLTNYASWDKVSQNTSPWDSRAVRDTSEYRTSEASLKLAPRVYGVPLNRLIPVNEGDKVYFEFWMKTDSNWNGTSSNSKFRFGNQTGTHLQSFPYHGVNTSWKKYSGTYSVPSGVTALKITIGNDGTTGNIWIDDIIIVKQQDSLFLKDGIIDDDKLASATKTKVDNGNSAKSTVDGNKTTWDRASNFSSSGTLATNKLSGTLTESQINSTSTNKWNSAEENAKKYVDETTGNLVNNPAVTGNHTGWSGSGLSSVTREFEGVSTRVLQSSVSSDTQNYSAYFKVDPSKAYEVSMWISKSVSGQYYVGLNGLNSSGSTVGFVQVSKSGGVSSSNNTNFYFQSGTVGTSWIKVVGYIMPVGTTPADMKGIGTTNSAIMKQNIDRIRVRFLNWSNAGTTRQLWVANPKVVEVDPNAILRGTGAKELTDAWRFSNTTEIDGGNIRTGTITADSIKAGSFAGKTFTGGTFSGATFTGGTFVQDSTQGNIRLDNKGLTIKEKSFNESIEIGITQLGGTHGGSHGIAFLDLKGNFTAGLSHYYTDTYLESSNMLNLIGHGGIVLNAYKARDIFGGYAVQVNGGLRISNGYITSGAIDTNATHIYTRPSSGGELRVTALGTTGTYRPIRAHSARARLEHNDYYFLIYPYSSTYNNNTSARIFYAGKANGGNPAYSVNFGASNGTAINVRAGAFNTNSLAELKEEIQPFPKSAKNIISNSDIYTYRMKSPDKDRVDSKKLIGLVIGDGYNTPTEVVDESESSVNLYNMVSLAWKAIKELSEENEALKNKIEKL